MNWILVNRFFSSHKIFWRSVAIGMALLMLIVNSAFGQSLGGVAALYMLPFFIAGSIVYRNSLPKAFASNLAIFFYAFLITLLENVLFGDAGLGSLLLFIIAPLLLVLILPVPLMARLAARDRVSRYLIVGGLFAGFIWGANYNLQIEFTFESLFEFNIFSYTFVGGVIGYLVAKPLSFFRSR